MCSAQVLTINLKGRGGNYSTSFAYPGTRPSQAIHLARTANHIAGKDSQSHCWLKWFLGNQRQSHRKNPQTVERNMGMGAEGQGGESGPDSTDPEVTLARPGSSPHHPWAAPQPSAPAQCPSRKGQHEFPGNRQLPGGPWNVLGRQLTLEKAYR